MSLPIFSSDTKDLVMLQTRWASQINPLLSNPIGQAYILKEVPLVIGNNTINHLQGRALNGYIVVGMHGAFAEIYDIPSTMPKLTLILNASAATTISLMVF